MTKKKGFYMKKNPLGKKGDFITAPGISILFAEMIAIWTILFWKYLKSPKKINLIEMGAGDGQMLYQFLITLDRFPLFKKACNIYIYEKSPYLKKIQKKKLSKYKIKWINKFKETKNVATLFFGNEFLDSFPIKQFVKKNKKWFEKFIFKGQKNYKMIDIETDIKTFENKFGLSLSKNQKFIEFSPKVYKILKEISYIVNKRKGGILFIDYGYMNTKMFNTLQSVKKHKFNNILKSTGNEDITYMLNFDLLKKIFNKFKLKVNGISSQEDFLIKLGIKNRAEIITKNSTFLKKADIYYRLERLIGKNQMGQLFKVIFATKKNIKFNIGFK